MNKEHRVEKDWKCAGLRCAVVASLELGHRCGYVGVPKSHLLHGADYDEQSVSEIEVHGGLTYANGRDFPVESDGLWWFGFDCAHYGDAPDPAIAANVTSHYMLAMSSDGEIRTLEYVTAECESLARQLASASEEEEAGK